MGSSREQAPLVIKMLGVRAVLALSFARIFYRNAINIGLPAVVVNTSAINEGDDLELDLSGGKVLDLSVKQELAFPKMSKTMEAILSEGGLLAYVEKYGDLLLA